MTLLVMNKFQTSVWNPTLPLGIHSWKCIWICLLRIRDHFVQRRWVKSFSRPTYLRVIAWAQDSAVCCAWTSVEQSRHYRTNSPLVGHYHYVFYHSWYKPTELRYRKLCRCLASNRHQAISNHRAREVERSATRQFLCSLTSSPSDNDNVLFDVHDLSMKFR